MTTKNTIHEWLQIGISKNATHLIIACDTFSYEDYPVYIDKKENVQEKYNEINASSMQKVMEVYNLSWPLEPQLKADRAKFF